MNRLIYADNAATTKLDTRVFEAMKPYLLEYYGNPSQPYSFSREPKKALLEARKTIAECIGADADEIYFTSGGTESDNWAIKGTGFASGSHKIIASSFEHHAVLNACGALERLGYPVTYLNPTTDGYILQSNLEKCISEKTRLVSVMYANNEIGTIQPVRELCDTAHQAGVLFHTDAVQAVGHVAINVHETGVDMLSASAHKFNGPKGVGFLYIRNGVKLLPLNDGGAQEKNMRAGTENVASIVGMAEALRINCLDMNSNIQHISRLTEQLIEGLDRAGIKYKRNGGNRTLTGLISLSFPDNDGEAILHKMDLMGICISTGSACDSVNTHISHVLRAIGLEEELAKGTIRISLGKDNTSDEVDRIVQALVKCLNHKI